MFLEAPLQKFFCSVIASTIYSEFCWKQSFQNSVTKPELGNEESVDGHLDSFFVTAIRVYEHGESNYFCFHYSLHKLNPEKVVITNSIEILPSHRTRAQCS